jgi:hypothetical protein
VAMQWHVAIAAVVTASVATAVKIVERPPNVRIGYGPGPACVLPPRACDGSPEYCAELVEIPMVGSGYVDVRLDGEQIAEISSSYLRRDLMMLVRYAAAKVACKAEDWTIGNGGAIALGDASERDGSTPGTWRGSPRHPPNTHVDGSAIDIAYFQRGTIDNQLRPICRHRSRSGADMYRCLDTPHRLDAWRTALFIGAFLEEPRIRVIGVDGVAAESILSAFDELCRRRMIEPTACDQRRRIRYETSNTGKGWFLGHHNHLHVSVHKE